MIRSFAFSLFLLGCTTQAAPPTLKEVKKIDVCGKSLRAEIARTEADRARGLMGRRELAAGRAMLFVFESERTLSFWMKNVPFDIDIGYFDASGNLVSHVTMAGTSPMQLESALPTYPSSGPAKYAVEVPAGFFKSLGASKCRLKPLL